MNHLKHLLHPSIIEIIIIVIIVLVAIFLLYRYFPRRLKQSYFSDKWKKLQALCKDQLTWPKAIVEADKLLAKALKRKKFKGKSMGEKMVSAQRTFTDNDSLWYAHNLYKKIADKKRTKLRQSEIKDALIGYRQALRDLGALPKDETK